jgi:hypothetical protein
MQKLRVGILFLALLLFSQTVHSVTLSEATLSTDESSDVLVNADQLSSIFAEQNWGFPFLTITERAFCDSAKNPWWTDFSAMPKELSAEFSNATKISDGLKVLPLVLVLNIETGQISVETESLKPILLLTNPKGYDAATQYANLFKTWYFMFCSGGEIDSCRKELRPERLALHVSLADVNDRAAYEAEQEAAVKAASALRSVENLTEGDSGGAEALAVYEVDFCGGIPVTAINAISNSNIRLQWVSQTNDTYAVQYADNMEWFNTWHLIGDNITSGSSNAVWDDIGVLSTNVTKRFYRVVRKDANYGLPCVTILSPTNGATLSGNVNVQVYATDNSRISSIALMIDGGELMAITDGPMRFVLPTAFFTNGVHTLTAVAVDDSIDEGQGIASNSVTVTIQNNINFTWYEAFGSVLPIQAKLTYSNANYTIQVTDESLNAIRTITGTTANGIISTNWDGKDGSGSQVAEDALYFLTLSAGPTGSLLAAAADVVTAGTFREKTWGTEVTILAREKLSIIPPWDTVSANKCNNIFQYITGSPSHQDVYGGGVQVQINASDWQSLFQALKATGTRNTQFYFTGHANGTAIGKGPGLEANTGMQTIDVELFLNNLYYTHPTTHLPVASFKFPYKFVFIDGCLSGNGDWMRAFGILSDTMDYSAVGRKNRAFMGWAKIQVEWLFTTTNGYTKFGTEFWNDWVTDDTTQLQNAVQQALSAATGVDPTKLITRGYNLLTWSD